MRVVPSRKNMTMKTILIFGMLCIGIHSVYAQTSPHGDVKIACDKCHTTDSWKMRKDAEFSHASTGFELTGAHQNLQCKSCHEKLFFAGAGKLCNSCHTDVHKGNLGAACLRCHSTQSWHIQDMVQRHQQTRFPLLGRHATTECQACHVQYAGQMYKGTPTTCFGCHNLDFQNTQSPNHIAAGFPKDCILCHQFNASTWGGNFNHQMTVFPLTGAHQAVPCLQCHLNNIFIGTPQDCYACHAAVYQSVQSPNHAAGGFSHLCLNCHTTNVWKPSTFSHDNTAFPLIGAHRAVICEQCHINNQYAGLHQNCIDCHQTDFNGATNPNHSAGVFSKNCLTCHGMNGWQPATFNHNNTNFPLTGTHTTLQCQLCHTGGNYQLSYTGCYTCHSVDYNGTANPNHISSGFSKTCETCHSTTNWNGASFDHTTTRFPLTGAHTTLQCALCHTNGNYQLSYTGCYTCHSADYNGTTNPNHATGGFSKTCETCHSTTNWTGASFDHTTTRFPLTGAHTTLQCALCHTNGNYQLSYTGCYACHSTNYNGTTNPNHAASGYPTTCETCHSTTAWTGAVFNHTWFPTGHGNANGVCSTCHTNPANYAVFQCTGCHTKTQTDSQHSGVSGYVWNSTNCYQCHPTGGGGG